MVAVYVMDEGATNINLPCKEIKSVHSKVNVQQATQPLDNVASKLIAKKFSFFVCFDNVKVGYGKKFVFPMANALM